jgi:F-type H+-transporting ATPase subunit delta
MRGASAEGLGVALERLEELAEAGDAEAIGAELLAVFEVLREEPALRRALTDPSSDVAARTGLAQAVFAGKVSDDAVSALTAAAAVRWASASDFVAAIEQLGVLAYVIEADRSGSLADLEDDLFRFGRVVSANPELRDAITNRQVPLAHRQDLVRELLQDRSSAATVRLAVQAVASPHQSFEATLEDYQEIAAERQARIVALVRSAVDLTTDEHNRLAAALADQYDHEVHLNVVVDPQVLGGIKVEIGDEVIDGTVASRIDDARRRMTS